MSAEWWALRAPAKVNLFLQVSARRPDGYHELQTVFHALDLEDELFVRRSDRPGEVSLRVESAGDGRGLAVAASEDNLVVRAARAYLGAARASASALTQGLDFVLHKRIPAGGGLGGGSSDAAAALRLCAMLDAAGGVGPPREASMLAEIAASLGADVPFFLTGGTQLGTGIGTELRRLPDLGLHALLLLPSFGTPTAAVYENYAPQLIADRPLITLRDIEARFANGLCTPADLHNDLESAASRACPELAELGARVRACGVEGVRLSGSGSTMFLASSDRGEIDRAERALAPLQPSVRLLRAVSARRDEPTRRAPDARCDREPGRDDEADRGSVER